MGIMFFSILSKRIGRNGCGGKFLNFGVGGRRNIGWKRQKELLGQFKQPPCFKELHRCYHENGVNSNSSSSSEAENDERTIEEGFVSSLIPERRRNFLQGKQRESLSGDEVIEQALDVWREGEVEDAIEIMRNYIREQENNSSSSSSSSSSPTLLECKDVLSEMLMYMGDYDEAKEYLLQNIKEQPNSQRHSSLAYIYYYMNDINQAIVSFFFFLLSLLLLLLLLLLYLCRLNLKMPYVSTQTIK